MELRSQGPAGEPRLADLLDDPVTGAVMRRDGVSRDELLETIRRARLALRWRSAGPTDIMDSDIRDNAA